MKVHLRLFPHCVLDLLVQVLHEVFAAFYLLILTCFEEVVFRHDEVLECACEE